MERTMMADQRVNLVQHRYQSILKQQTELQKASLKSNLTSKMLSPLSNSPPVLRNETYFLIKLLKEIVELL